LPRGYEEAEKMTQQPGNFTDTGVKGRPSLDPVEQGFSVAIGELEQAVKDSRGIEPEMKAVRGYVAGAALPGGVLGPSDTAARLVKTWNKAMSQRQKELKAMYDVVNDLPDRLARTIEKYLKNESDTAGEIDYFSKFEERNFDQLNDAAAEWSADPASGAGAVPDDDSAQDGAGVPNGANMNEEP
jgi:hypothetical protein